MMVYCVLSLESPHRAILMSTHNICHLSIEERKITLNYHKSAWDEFFSEGLKNEFETAVVDEPSVFEPLKFYCILHTVKH